MYGPFISLCAPGAEITPAVAEVGALVALAVSVPTLVLLLRHAGPQVPLRLLRRQARDSARVGSMAY
ncbi:hypothetical protein ACFTXM_11775 [Streptomyces sp. NPDC056930]|uniref:hypothetical protein n=1 Tax=Streptomyces sp. NPDC056930 TaxID=3345967 RepID=UPI00362B84E7